jgi:hypothetical protein
LDLFEVQLYVVVVVLVDFFCPIPFIFGTARSITI